MQFILFEYKYNKKCINIYIYMYIVRFSKSIYIFSICQSIYQSNNYSFFTLILFLYIEYFIKKMHPQHNSTPINKHQSSGTITTTSHRTNHNQNSLPRMNNSNSSTISAGWVIVSSPLSSSQNSQNSQNSQTVSTNVNVNVWRQA